MAGRKKRWSREEVLTAVDSGGFDWLNPVDVFPVKYNLVLKCRTCSSSFRRSWENWLYHGYRSCPSCMGHRNPTMGMDALRQLFCQNRIDGQDYVLSGQYILKHRRKLYRFKHLVCDGEFWGSKEFFWGKTGCPLCSLRKRRKSVVNDQVL